MLNYPILFKSAAQASRGIDIPWKIESAQATASCAVPEEFGGSGGGFSPEDLYAQALANCFLATFKVYANASRIEFETVEAESTLTVDKNEVGLPFMKHCFIAIRVNGAHSPLRIKTLVEKALKSGFILNSVKTHIESSLEIDGKFLLCN